VSLGFLVVYIGADWEDVKSIKGIIETFRILAASRAYSSGSIVLAPAGAFICSPSFDYDGGT
jgi:hypothetical protein